MEITLSEFYVILEIVPPYQKGTFLFGYFKTRNGNNFPAVTRYIWEMIPHFTPKLLHVDPIVCSVNLTKGLKIIEGFGLFN